MRVANRRPCGDTSAWEQVAVIPESYKRAHVIEAR